jgi:U2-associated protein SR140
VEETELAISAEQEGQCDENIDGIPLHVDDVDGAPFDDDVDGAPFDDDVDGVPLD